MRLSRAFTCLLLTMLPVVSRADSFNLIANIDSSTDGGFTTDAFTINAVLTASSNGDGSYTVTDISGDGVEGLDPPYGSTNNLIFPGTSQVVNNGGLAFEYLDLSAPLPMLDVTLFASGDNVYEAILDPYYGDPDPIVFYPSATVQVTSTPEPSSFALLGTGLLGIAGVGWKRFA